MGNKTEVLKLAEAIQDQLNRFRALENLLPFSLNIQEITPNLVIASAISWKHSHIRVLCRKEKIDLYVFDTMVSFEPNQTDLVARQIALELSSF